MAHRRAEVPPPDGRTALAAEQAALVRALTGGGRPPDGFDIAGVDAAARALVQKRARSVARARPALARALGVRFVSLFAEFAARARLPARGGPSADAYEFLRWLARAGLLDDDELRLELARARLRHRRWRFAAAWLRQSRRLVVGTVLPGAGARWLSLPLAPRRLSGTAPPPPASDHRA